MVWEGEGREEIGGMGRRGEGGDRWYGKVRGGRR